MIGRMVMAVVLCLLPQVLRAQITAEASKEEVTLQERFQVTYVIEGDAEDFQAPDFSHFRVLSGPQRSSRLSIINGRISRSTSYSYILQPRQVGTFMISPAVVRTGINRIEHESDPLKIVVREAPARSEAQADNLQDKPVFINVDLSKQRVYQGEQLVATFTLYSRHRLVELEPLDFPDLTNFWAEDFEMPDRLGVEQKRLNGEMFYTVELKRTALFPQKSGKLFIEPMELDVVVQIQTREPSFFDPWGASRNERVSARSQRQVIEVLPLPEENRPEDFSGLVGDFALSSEMERQSLKAGEATTLSYRITGEGNLTTIPVPEPEAPAGIEVYDPEVEQEVNRYSSTLRGRVSYDYLLVPRDTGRFVIPPQQLSYFDPEQERYVTLRGEEYVLEVAPGEGGFVQPPKRNLPAEEQLAGIATEARLHEDGEYFFFSPLFVAGMVAPLALAGVLFLFVSRRKRAEERERLQEQDAAANSKKRLAQAKEHLQQQEKEPFYTAVYTAIVLYLQDRLEISTSDFTREQVAERLRVQQVPEEQVSEVQRLLNHCEMARYAPMTGQVDMQQTFEQANSLLTQLQEVLR